MSDKYTLKTRYWDSGSMPQGGHVPAEIELSIDWDKIALILARKASRNKSRTSTMLSGAIKGKLK